MNCDTGRLIKLLEGQELPEGFMEVPKELEEEAYKQLGENKSVIVDMERDTPLTEWARGNRKERRKKEKKRCKRQRR